MQMKEEILRNKNQANKNTPKTTPENIGIQNYNEENESNNESFDLKMFRMSKKPKIQNLKGYYLDIHSENLIIPHQILKL